MKTFLYSNKPSYAPVCTKLVLYTLIGLWRYYGRVKYYLVVTHAPELIICALKLILHALELIESSCPPSYWGVT